jgi:integrase
MQRHVVKKRLADGSIREYIYDRTRRKEQPIEAKSLLALLRAYQRSPEWARLRPVTQATAETYLRPLLKIGHYRVEDVRRKHILLIRDRMADTRGHGAAAAFCRAASRLFSWAVDREWIEHSPATRLRGGLDSGTLPTWTMEQAIHAIAALPPPYSRAVMLALHTGQRRGDLCRLRWDAFTGSHLLVAQQKTAKRGREAAPLSIPLRPEMIAALDAWKRDARGLTILETARGKPWIPGYLSRTLPLELQRTGLPRGLNIHGLRKLAAVTLAEAGCSTHEIAAITGHRTLAMVQHYTEAVNQRTLSEAAVVKLASVNRAGNRLKRQ